MLLTNIIRSAIASFAFKLHNLLFRPFEKNAVEVNLVGLYFPFWTCFFVNYFKLLGIPDDIIVSRFGFSTKIKPMTYYGIYSKKINENILYMVDGFLLVPTAAKNSMIRNQSNLCFLNSQNLKPLSDYFILSGSSEGNFYLNYYNYYL